MGWILAQIKDVTAKEYGFRLRLGGQNAKTYDSNQQNSDLSWNRWATRCSEHDILSFIGLL
jgi:hypothetical protein